MRVLVTGASGFVGRRCVAALVAEGVEVHGADVHEMPGPPPSVSLHRLDLLEAGAAERLLERVAPTHLLHLAWFASHGVFWTSPENLRWVSASLSLIRAFRENGGRRLVCSGSCAEYDWGGEEPCDEFATALKPRTLYGASKDALRRVVDSYARQEGISAAWGRLFFLYGPGEHPNRLIPAVTIAWLRGERPRCSHGRQVRDFMYVDDVADGLVRLLLSDVDGPVNVASGQARRLVDIIDAVRQAIPGAREPDLGAIPSPADDPPTLVARTDRLRDEVGFAPRVDLEEGLRRCVDFWSGDAYRRR